jgi:hypothetical protein
LPDRPTQAGTPRPSTIYVARHAPSTRADGAGDLGPGLGMQPGGPAGASGFVVLRHAGQGATRTRDATPVHPRLRARLVPAVVAVLALALIGPASILAAPRDVVEEPDARVGSALPVCYPPKTASAAADEEPPPDPSPPPSPTPPPTPKPTPWPVPPGVQGLDVSHWNGFPDFVKLSAAGMRYVFSKATQGHSFVDDTYRRHTREAKQAGLEVGAYHFFDYQKGGKKQAQHFLDTLRATTGLNGLLPLVVDVECLQSIGTSDHAKAKQRLHALMNELYRQTGRYPMIYTSQSMWTKVVGAPASFGKYPLWVACWKCNNLYMPKGWSEWLFWQVGLFRFPGVANLDGNIFRSTAVKQLRAVKQRPIKLDGGARFALSRGVRADLRGVDGRDVRVALGDGTFGEWQPFQRQFDLQLAPAQGPQDVRLQLRSFRGVSSPVFRASIVLDSVAPAISGPRLSLTAGVRVPKSGAKAPARASISARDATSGLESSALRASCGGSQRAASVGVAGEAKLAFNLDVKGCEVAGEARDVAGHTRTKALKPRVQLVNARSNSKQLTLTGVWKTIRRDSAVKGTLLRATGGGAEVRLRFTGAQFAVVARRGPDSGQVMVILGGKHIDTIDLYSPTVDNRRVVLVRNVPSGTHVLKLRATGASAAEASGTNVWLDAILVLDRRN